VHSLVKSGRKRRSKLLSLRIAATTSLEFLLLTSANKQFQSEEVRSRLCKFIQSLLRVVTTDEIPPENQEEYFSFQFTSSRVLGGMIGRAMNSDEDDGPTSETNSSFLLCSEAQDCIRNEVFPALKVSAFTGSEGKKGDRYDRRALCTACSSNSKLAGTIVVAHLQALLESLAKSLTDSSTFARLEALSYVIRNSDGDNVIRAFHENGIVDDILDSLSTDLKADTSAQLRSSIAQVALPATDEENDALISKIDAVSKIESGLLPAYNRLVPRERMTKLLKAVSQKVPPLSKADEGDLFVRLPILAAALQSAVPSMLQGVLTEVNEDDKELVPEFLQGLTDYALSAEHPPSGRTAAASCVHAILKNGFGRDVECPVKPLMEQVSNTLVVSSANVCAVTNCLNILSVLGSAAALRGSASKSTADAIARFLVEVSCEQSAILPCVSDGKDKREDRRVNLLSSYKEDSVRNSIQIASASAYGAILLEEDIKPLMKQRLTHACLKYIKQTFEKESHEAQSGAPVSAPQIGLLLVVCHLVCSSDLSKFDRATIHMVATVSVEGLSSDLFQGRNALSEEWSRARMLVICAVLKLICAAPATVNGFVLTMVSGLLRSYAVSDPDSEVGCKLIILQALEQVAHLEGAKTTVAAVKPAVLAILASAMNQRSGLLRSAAVDVRNAWCIVD